MPSLYITGFEKRCLQKTEKTLRRFDQRITYKEIKFMSQSRSLYLYFIFCRLASSASSFTDNGCEVILWADNCNNLA